MSSLRPYCLIILLCITQISFAQKFKWLKSYGTKTMVESLTGLVTEKSGNSVFVLSLNRIDTTLNDTLFLGNSSYYFTGNKDRESYIIRVDSAGNLLNEARLGKFYVSELCSDHKGSYFIIGNANTSWNNTSGMTEVNGVNYKNDSGVFIFARLDSNFNFVWVTQTGNKYGAVLTPGFTGKSNIPLTFSENKLLFSVLCVGVTKIGNKKYNFGNGRSPVFGGINTSTGKIMWSNYIYNDNTPNSFDHEMSYISKVISKNNMIYLTFNNGVDYFALGSDNFYSRTSHIMRMDSLGNYIDRLEFDFKVLLRDFQVFDDKLFFSGIFGDTIHFGKKKINLQRSSGSNYYECFVACISVSLQPVWFYTPKVTSGGSAGSYITHLIINDSALYLNGITLCSLLMAETALMNGNFTAKLDLKGNVLWAAFGGGTDASAKCISASSKKGVFIGGAFRNTMSYENHTVTSKGSPNYHDGFLLKILDNVIIRGNVRTGPYCAGDSILIPYSKIGEYDSSNIFRAQLSNENGNFDSGYHDLGQLKSNKNGVVKGVLPYLKISTSPKYRIRIVSTSPVVQSYFMADSLLLLIYSKDQADAGKDTTICNGKSVNLKTPGGSLWEWSPDYNLSNTDKPATTASPKITTTYRVIISDSSGCGITDTAYVTINVKKSPEIESTISDTTLCLGARVSLPVRFLYGDSLNYNWMWYEQASNGIYKKYSNGFIKDRDTLVYGLPNNPPNIQRLRLILKDNCSAVSDTANFTIRPRSALELALNSMDTILCTGNSYTWRAKGTGGYPPGYKFTWINVATGQSLSTTDSLRIIANSTVKVSVSLKDKCMPDVASAPFTITVNPPLNFKIFDKNNIPAKDTTLCFGQSIQLYAKGSGGKGNGYSYNWKINSVSISQSDTLIFNTKDHFSKKAGGIQMLALEVSDNCTVPSYVSKKTTITVLPEPTVAITFPDTVCFKNRAILKVTTSGGKSPYQYKWTDEKNVLQGNADNLIIDNNNSSQTGTIKRIVIVKTGCIGIDTFTTVSEFLRPFSVTLTPADTCLTGPVLLNINPQGGKGNYKVEWYKDKLFLGTSEGTQIATPTSKPSLFMAIIKDGCIIEPDTLKINLALRPEVKLTVNGFCLSDTTIFIANSSFLTKYNWQVSSSNIFIKDSFLKAVYPVIGNYRTTVSTDNTLPCIARDTVDFTIIEKPKADFTYLHIKDFSNGIPFQFTDKSTNADGWMWQFGTTGNSKNKNPKYTFTDTGYMSIRQIASNQNICFDSTEKIIPVFQKIFFYFPNAFSPNNNGTNDDFGLNPNQYYLVREYHLEIYNRWGEKVFQTDDVTEHWLTSVALGKLGPQQGVYMFKAIITDIFDEKQEITGAVEVLK